MTSLTAWWRAGHLRRMEAMTRYAAAVYLASKSRYEAAIAAEGGKDAADQD